MVTELPADDDVVATTARLRLRNWVDDDIAPFMRHLNTEPVMRWLGGVQTAEQFRAAYDRIQQCRRDHGHCFWIVERTADRALLGFCGIKRVNAVDAPMIGAFEIGWRLREDAWGHGYAREAAERSLDLAFGQYGAPDVVAITVRQNAASWGLMHRLGLTRARDLDFIDRRMPAAIAENTIVYRITKGDMTH